MIINFDKLDETVQVNFKGGEKDVRMHVFDNKDLRVLTLRLESGASIGSHTHEADSETMYVVKGRGKVIYDGKEWEIREGNCHFCKKGHTHAVINDGEEELVIFAQINR